ncbi:LuxR C-terminal-related transcriptional regulator [Microbacterium sp. NPDC056569]|uniref:helix-turn-helix transcriptional regulator n=1 Tax=Microbacterium sp. NPDC056569 TaxID=3345867 RepID=UPI00366AD288
MAVQPLESALAPWPLTGRAAIVQRSTAALTGHVRTLVISGASGVGKSRAVAAVGEGLAAHGWAVLHATGTSIMSTVPLGALLPLFPTDRAQLSEASTVPATLLDRAIVALDAVAPSPRLLVIDDLGLLDPLSATLVAQLVAVDALRIAATLRSGDALPDPFMSTWSADRALRIELAPLDVETIRELLAHVLAGPVAHRTASDLERATGGNPLYLRELVVGALESGRLAAQAGVWQLTGDPVGSPALRDLILARVAQLDPDERDVVDRLAVTGELRAAHLVAPGARDALARLENAGLVHIGERLEVRLAHPQYAAVVASSLSRLRTADLLLEQAELLDRDGTTAADALRTVTWRLAAGADADPEILASTARLARQAGDHRTVDRLATAALSAGGPRPDLLLLRGEALLRMGRVSEALEQLHAGAALGPDGELATAITATTAMAHASVHEGLAEALAVLRGADGGGAPDPSLALIRALIELYSNNAAEADRIVCGVAGGFGDSPAEQAIIAASRAQPLAALGRTDEALAAAETALAFARATQGRAIPGHTVANALLTLGTVQLHAGSIDAARATATEALVEAIDADDEIVSRSIEFLLGRIAADAGLLETAARWFRDTMSGAMTAGPISLYIPGLASLAVALIAHGDLDDARRELASVPAGVDTGPGGLIARAWLSALDGDLGTARRLLVDEAQNMAETGHVFLAGTFLVHLARMGGADAAAHSIARLAAGLPQSPLLAMQAAHVAAEAGADCAGLEAAGEAWAAHGAHLLAAEAFASAARAARAAGEQRHAMALQNRSDVEAARCEGPATPLLRFSEELTPLTRREREIATLAADGASSKDIAAKLFLSTRTVDNHLQSVYGKLGISGRHELARL